MYAFQRITFPLAYNHRAIKRCLEGKESKGGYIAHEIEDALIHFTHARRLKPEEASAPASHKAKATVDYIALLDGFHPEMRSLYAHLCESTHPAAASVWYMFSVDKHWKTCRFGAESDRRAIDEMLRSYKPACESLIEPAFNPVFLVLRVLHKFDLFPKIPELRKLNFSVMPIWPEIKAALRR